MVLGAIITLIDNKEKYTFKWKGQGRCENDREYILNLYTSGCYILTVTDALANCYIDTYICLVYYRNT